MTQVKNELNPFHDSPVLQYRDLFEKFFSQVWWVKEHDTLIPDMWDYVDELREALINFLESDRIACLKFTGEEGIFHHGTQGPRPSSGIDFPFMDSEVHDHIMLKMILTYRYNPDKDIIRVDHKMVVMHSGGSDRVTDTLPRRYSKKGFVGMYKYIDREIERIKRWQWKE